MDVIIQTAFGKGHEAAGGVVMDKVLPTLRCCCCSSWIVNDFADGILEIRDVNVVYDSNSRHINRVWATEWDGTSQ